MKRLIFVLFIFTMTAILSSSFYASSGDMTFTVDEACQEAVKNSRQAVLDELEIQMLENALERASKNAEKLSDTYGRSSVLSNKITREIGPLEAETELEAAKRGRDDSIESLKRDVRKKVLDILLAEEELEYEKDRLELLEQRYENTLSKLEKGLISENEAVDMEYSVDSARLDVKSAEQRLVVLDMELKRLLSLSPEGEPLKIQGDIGYDPLKDPSVDVLVETAIENDTGIYRSERALLAAQRTFEITSEYYKEGEGNYDDALFELRMAEAELENSKVSLEVNIRNMYNDLLSLENKVESAERSKRITERKLETAKTKHEKDLISLEEYMDAQQQLKKDELKIQQARQAYMVKKIDFSKWTD